MSPALLGTLEANGPLVLTGVVSPAQITADQNDYSPTGLSGAEWLRVDVDASGRTITGLSGGSLGRIVWLVNVSGSFNFILSHQDVLSAVGNRFVLPYAQAMTVPPNGQVQLIYDGTTSRWRASPVAVAATAVPTNSLVADTAGLGVEIVRFARSDHKHGRESFATNAVLLGTAAAAGAATTPMRSNDTIAAFDATAPAAVVAGAASTAGSVAFAARRDHTHQGADGIASRTSSTAAIANTETQVLGFTIPANLLTAGSSFRITASGTGTTSTSPGSTIFRIRCGTTTLTGNIIATLTVGNVASISGQPFWLDAIVTLRSTGASGTMIGNIFAIGTSVTTGLFTSNTSVTTTPATAVVDTTANKILELTVITGSASSNITFTTAIMDWTKV